MILIWLDVSGLIHGGKFFMCFKGFGRPEQFKLTAVENIKIDTVSLNKVKTAKPPQKHSLSFVQ